MKKTKLLIITLVLLSITSCNNSNNETINKNSITENNTQCDSTISIPEENPNTITKLISPEKNSTIRIIDDDVYDYMTSNKNIKSFVGLKKDYQKEVILSWKTNNLSIIEFRVSIATDFDFTNEISITTSKTSIKITNLLVGTTYFWKVNDSSVRMFKTEDINPRYINVEGINNVRDLGGIKTKEGNSIVQGLIYRGSEMNNNFIITDNGKQTMLEDLHIKTDLDLRTTKETNNIKNSPLGENINYVNIPSFEGYTKVIANKQKDNYQQIFKLLAKKESYPLYFHCYLGADRTGTIAGIIEGLMGVDDENINKDYELTTFSSSDDTAYRDASDKFVFVSKNISMLYQEDTYQKSIEKYLIDFVGITEKEVENIKNILSGKEKIIDPTICKIIN